jgi:hypothetical protein
VAITVNPIPAAPAGTPGSNCGAGVVAISATSTVVGATIEWYATTTSTAVLFTGATYTPNINATTTYYSAARLSGGCVSTRTAVVATINALPAVPTGTAGARCGIGTVVLGANAVAGTTVDWYAAPTGGSVLAGGTGVTSFTTPSINATTTFYAQRRNTTTGCVSSTRVAVTATVNPLSVAGTINGAGTVCSGTNSTVLRLTGSTGSIQWQVSTNNSTFTNIAGATALTFTATNLTATTYYRAVVTSGSCTPATTASATIAISALAAPTGTAGSRCGAGPVLLTATPPSGSTIDWYAVSTGGAVLTGGSGVTSFTTPNISVATTYYAASRNLATGCVSTTRTAVRATINPLLAATSSITGTTAICPLVGTTTRASYTATAITGATTYKWTLPAGATIVGTSTGRTISVQFSRAVANSSITVQGVASTGCAGNPRSLALNTTACATPTTLLTTSNNVKPDNLIAPKTIVLDAKVFPNPSLGIFNLNVKSSSDEIIHVRVMNLSGKVLQVTQMTPSSTISVARDVIPGMYLIEIRQGDQLKTLKAVKL